MSQNQRRKSSRKRKSSPVSIPLLLGLGGLVLITAAVLAFLGGNRSKAPQAEIEVTGSPSLKVDREVVDLGDVKLGQTVEATFQLTNVGDRPLQFTEQPYIEVKEGC